MIVAPWWIGIVWALFRDSAALIEVQQSEEQHELGKGRSSQSAWRQQRLEVGTQVVPMWMEGGSNPSALMMRRHPPSEDFAEGSHEPANVNDFSPASSDAGHEEASNDEHESGQHDSAGGDDEASNSTVKFGPLLGVTDEAMARIPKVFPTHDYKGLKKKILAVKEQLGGLKKKRKKYHVKLNLSRVTTTEAPPVQPTQEEQEWLKGTAPAQNVNVGNLEAEKSTEGAENLLRQLMNGINKHIESAFKLPYEVERRNQSEGNYYYDESEHDQEQKGHMEDEQFVGMVSQYPSVITMLADPRQMKPEKQCTLTGLESMLSTYCCSTSVNEKVGKHWENCGKTYTYKMAYEFCREQGFRLCSQKEVEDCRTCDNGCPVEPGGTRIWTATPCHPKHFPEKGTAHPKEDEYYVAEHPDSQGSLAQRITDLRERYKVLRQHMQDTEILLHKFHNTNGSGADHRLPFQLDPVQHDVILDDWNLQIDSPGHAGGRGNLVVGVSNDASGADNSFVAGTRNTAIGSGVSVVGGEFNYAQDYQNAILGGRYNRAVGNHSAVIGGMANTASETSAVVVGGEENSAKGEGATVLGGNKNTAKGRASTVSGGSGGEAVGDFSNTLSGAKYTASQQGETVPEIDYAYLDNIGEHKLEGPAPTDIFGDHHGTGAGPYKGKGKTKQKGKASNDHESESGGVDLDHLLHQARKNHEKLDHEAPKQEKKLWCESCPNGCILAGVCTMPDGHRMGGFIKVDSSSTPKTKSVIADEQRTFMLKLRNDPGDPGDWSFMQADCEKLVKSLHAEGLKSEDENDMIMDSAFENCEVVPEVQKQCENFVQTYLLNGDHNQFCSHMIAEVRKYKSAHGHSLFDASPASSLLEIDPEHSSTPDSHAQAHLDANAGQPPQAKFGQTQDNSTQCQAQGGTYCPVATPAQIAVAKGEAKLAVPDLFMMALLGLLAFA